MFDGGLSSGAGQSPAEARKTEEFFSKLEDGSIPIEQRYARLEAALSQGELSPNALRPYDEYREKVYKPRYVVGGETLLSFVATLSVAYLNAPPRKTGSSPAWDARLTELVLRHGGDQSISNPFGGDIPLTVTQASGELPAHEVLFRAACAMPEGEKKSAILDRATSAALLSNDTGEAKRLIEAGGKITQEAVWELFSSKGEKVTPQTLAFMKERGADFFVKDPRTQENLLHVAAHHADPARMAFLLTDVGLSPNERDSGLHTPLMVLAAAARVDASSRRIEDPFPAPSLGDRARCADLLLAAGADKKARNEEGLYAVDFLQDSFSSREALYPRLKIGGLDRAFTKVGSLFGGRKKDEPGPTPPDLCRKPAVSGDTPAGQNG